MRDIARERRREVVAAKSVSPSASEALRLLRSPRLLPCLLLLPFEVPIRETWALSSSLLIPQKLAPQLGHLKPVSRGQN